MKSWKTYFIELTLQVATKSKDPSRQVGCIIVGPDKEIRSTGFNGFPRGVKETKKGVRHFPTGIWKNMATGEEETNCGGCKETIVMTTGMGTLHVLPPHFTQGTPDVLSDRWERPQKYQYVEHAERNAIYNAARTGVPLNGCSAFVSLAPCADCARAMIQAGIVEVYGPAFPKGIEYKDYGFEYSKLMMHEAGVKYIATDYDAQTTEDTA